ncbi:protein YLS3 isoform X2 [Sesamum indicum]|uniref:Protein YLS3 isoform X2 n=1 Tax=Sesamum indicum TaxID=4182 RepID=A0A6I9TSV5_SESIN|nr:protein YLS3 isoform X2 [Sesamum indicum]
MNSHTNNIRSPPLLLVLILMFSALATSDTSKDREECAESLVGLATCLPYVGGTAKAPTPDCCTALKQLLNTKKKCLCVIIKDRNDPDLGLNINVTLALGLPQVCNAPANVSQCPALLKLPPDSPEAQIFYQFGQKSSNSSSSSPVAEGPNANVKPTPITTPVGASNPGSSAQQNSGSDNGKSCLGLEILSGLLLISTLIIQF